MFPNYKDFQIAVYYTLGKSTSQAYRGSADGDHREFRYKIQFPHARTPVTAYPHLRENHPPYIRYNGRFKRDPLFRRPYPCRPYRKGKHLLDEYENEMNQRLPFIISRKKFKRHTQEELAKAYRELNEYPD